MLCVYKDVIYVCLFVFPIITQEPLDRFASNLDWGTRLKERKFSFPVKSFNCAGKQYE